ncbi:ABC transporter permease, partial [Streptomyces salyersiae]
YDGRTALAGLEAPLHQSMLIANAVWIIVVFVAAVALLNTLTLSVLERRREIGVLRAMGSSRRYTLAMVLAEAAAIGIVGGILGLALGLIDQWLFSLVSGDIMNFNVTFRPSAMALVFTLGALAISLLGSLPPARRAARLNIIEAVSVE